MVVQAVAWREWVSFAHATEGAARRECRARRGRLLWEVWRAPLVFDVAGGGLAAAGQDDEPFCVSALVRES